MRGEIGQMLPIWKSGRIQLVGLFTPTMPLPLKCLVYRAFACCHFFSLQLPPYRSIPPISWWVWVERGSQWAPLSFRLGRLIQAKTGELPPHSLRLKPTSDAEMTHPSPFSLCSRVSSILWRSFTHRDLRSQVPELTQVYTNSYVHEGVLLTWESLDISPTHGHASYIQFDTCHIVGTVNKWTEMTDSDLTNI